MKFFTSLVFAGAAALAAAAENPFIVPTTGFAPVAGQSINIQWNPTAGDTVTLVLREGASSNLQEGSPIAQHIANSGNFTWAVDSKTVRGSDYTIEIINDDDPTETNYYPYFVLDSTFTVATTTSTFSYGAPTATPAALSSAAATSAGPHAVSAADVSTSSASGSTKTTMATSASTGSASSSGSATRTESESGSTATSGSSTASASGNAPSSGAAANRVAGGLAVLAAGIALVV